MVWRILLVLVVTLAILVLPGCKKKAEPAEPAQVKITKENLDSELDKMESEVDADIAAEQ